MTKNKIKPTSKEELKQLIEKEIELYGNECSLNHIDVSQITDMIGLFHASDFNGDISSWNTANVIDMKFMFFDSKFSGNISRWDTRSVRNMYNMFYASKFNGDLSKWDVSCVQEMKYMFLDSQFKGDISNWDVNRVTNMFDMFSQDSTNKPWWYIEDNIVRAKILKEHKSIKKEQKTLNCRLPVSNVNSKIIKL